jgi:hypothetical protein
MLSNTYPRGLQDRSLLRAELSFLKKLLRSPSKRFVCKPNLLYLIHPIITRSGGVEGLGPRAQLQDDCEYSLLERDVDNSAVPALHPAKCLCYPC